MKTRTWVLVIVAAFFTANAVGYFAVRSRRHPALNLPVTKPGSPGPAAGSPEARAREESGRARRAAGLVALEAGDYDKALIQFTEAQTLLGESANVADLVKVTQDLRTRERERAGLTAAAKPSGSKTVDTQPGVKTAPVQLAAVPSPTPAPPPAPVPAPAPAPTPAPHKEPPPVAVAAAPVVRHEPPPPPPAPTPAPVVRHEPPPPAPERHRPEPRSTKVASVEKPDAPEPTGMGLLLVTTNPRGLDVHVDGSMMDTTPLRTPIKVGLHKVAIYDGDRKLSEQTVDVGEGAISTVNKDLSVEMAPPPKPSAVAAASPRPDPTPVAVAPVAKDPPVKAPGASGTGGLDVTSPGLYAEVWINNHPYGFPPVSARDLPAGETKVEVRVNGEVKRSASFNVVGGQVAKVKLR